MGDPVTHYYFNGELTEGDISLPPDAPAVRMGLGVFETVLWRDGRPMHFQRHLRRMAEAGEYLGVLPPADDHEQAVFALMDSCPLPEGEARINLHWLVLKDGSPAVLVVRATAYSPPEETIPLGLTLYPEVQESHLAVFKNHSSAHYHLATRYAAQQSAYDAVLVDSKGAILEAARGTLVFRRGNDLVVPASRCRMRSISLQILAEHVAVTEVCLTHDDLCASDSCFYLNSLVGALAVERVEDRILAVDLNAAREFRRWIRG